MDGKVMLTNAKIKEIKKLNEKSKARREAGLFVTEGPRMFVEAPLEWVETRRAAPDRLCSQMPILSVCLFAAFTAPSLMSQANWYWRG